MTAVDDLSFDVARGEFFGFLGPNGAGKTTTINAIVGLAPFQSGTIEVFGHDVVSDFRAARARIGLSPQEFNFDRYLTVEEILLYQGGYYGMRMPQARSRARELLERFELTDKRRVVPLMLSGGSVRRMALDQAHLLDVPATAAWALGVVPPDVYVGRAFAEAFEEDATTIIEKAVAVA